MIVLHEIYMAAGQFGKLALAETFKKESTVIAEYFGCDDQQVGDGSMYDFYYGKPFSLSTRIR